MTSMPYHPYPSQEIKIKNVKNIECQSIRHALKLVRDPTKNAYDYLPSGETIGEFANRQAVEKYSRKKIGKRDRAREKRNKMKHCLNNISK